MTCTNKLILTLVTLAMVGCTSNPRDKLNKGQNVKDIFENNETVGTGTHGYYPASNSNLAGYTRTEENELSQLFPELDNPTIYLYSFPHISKSGLPVPGYTTSIKLYEKSVNYALPGEE